MGKGDRKKKLPKAKKATEGFGLAPTPKREKSGCFVERTRQQREGDPREEVLAARCRRIGIPNTVENRLSMNHSVFGDDAGIVINVKASGNSERDLLWKTFCDLDRAEETYHRRILQKSRHAKCGKMEILPERFEAQMSDSIDTRDDDEKDRDAVNNWMRWRGYVDHLDAEVRTDFWAGVYLRRELHRNGAPTEGGKAFFKAIKALSEVVTAAQKR